MSLVKLIELKECGEKHDDFILEDAGPEVGGSLGSAMPHPTYTFPSLWSTLWPVSSSPLQAGTKEYGRTRVSAHGGDVDPLPAGA